MASNRYFYCRIHTYPFEKPEKETKHNNNNNNNNNQYNKNILNGM
jgi:hypothetical protein